MLVNCVEDEDDLEIRRDLLYCFRVTSTVGGLVKSRANRFVKYISKPSSLVTIIIPSLGYTYCEMCCFRTSEATL